MWKYIRLLRLQDQYLQFTGAILAGIFLHAKDWNVLWWAIAVTLMGFAAFIVNEVTDRADTDKYSSNPVHITRGEHLDMRIVNAMFIVASASGIILSWYLGYVLWGVAIYAIGICYSLEPIRLKRRPGFDLGAQALACMILPFLALTWGHASGDLSLAFLVVVTLVFLSAGFPYQIADFVADKKSGIRSLHVALGVDGSLMFGLGLGSAGILLYLLFGVYRWEWWTIPGAILFPITLVYYVACLRLRTFAQKITMTRNYSKITLWITRLVALYLVLIWRFV